MAKPEKVDLKQELVQQAADLQKPAEENVKLKRNMTIPDMVKALGPELKKSFALCHYAGEIYQNCPECVE